MKKSLLVAALTVATPALAEISYSELLATPDDVALNEQYVRERIQAGDLSQALAAVERIILIQPLNINARIIRARVLMGLGNFGAAEQELRALDVLPLPAAAGEQIDALLADVESEQNPWSAQGFVSLGMSRDDNVGNHTDTGFVANASGVQDGRLVDSEGFETQRSDTAAQLHTGLTLTYDLGTQDRDMLYVSARGGVLRGDRSELRDEVSKGLTLGVRAPGPVNAHAYLSFDETHRSTLTDSRNTSAVPQDDVTTQGVGLQLSTVWQQTTLTSSTTYNTADFSGRQVSDRSDANTVAQSFDLFKPINDQWAMTGRIGAEHRRADKPTVDLANETQDRNTRALNVGAIYLPAMGHRVTASVGLKSLQYKQRLLTDQYIRDDRQTTLSLGYTLMGAALSPALSDWSFNANAQHSKTDSNMITYDVTKNTVGLSTVYQFGD